MSGFDSSTGVNCNEPCSIACRWCKDRNENVLSVFLSGRNFFSGSRPSPAWLLSVSRPSNVAFWPRVMYDTSLFQRGAYLISRWSMFSGIDVVFYGFEDELRVRNY